MALNFEDLKDLIQRCQSGQKLIPRKKKTVLSNVTELILRESARNNHNKFEQVKNNNNKTSEVIKSLNHSPKYKLIQSSKLVASKKMQIM